jgi:superfamily II DNA or RNA helicase
VTALLEAPCAQRPSGRLLRPYQHEAGAAVVEDWASGVVRTVVLLPTGCGKTDVIAAMATDEARRGGRVLVLAHRTELLDQITDRIAQHDHGLRVGRVQGQRDEIHYPITCAMIQTLAGRRHGQYRRLARLPQPTMVIVDECHHAAAPGYLAVLKGLGCYGPDAVLTVPGCEQRLNRSDAPAEPVAALGVTATLVRGDDAALGDVWESVAFARDIGWAVRLGFLVQPKGRVVVADSVKLDKAKVRRGDYTDGELGKMITQSAAQIVADWIEHGRHADGTPRTTAAFCPDLESAHALAAEFIAAGVACGVVTGATNTTERRKLYRALAAGTITVLVSVMVLTEGWDCPRVSCILQCRPTKLPGLYTQIVGRGLRPWDLDEARRLGHADETTPAKVDCLILDVVGASRGQKLTTLVDLHESSEYDTSELDEALACPLCGEEHEGQCPLDAGDLDLGDDPEPEPTYVDPAGPAKDYAELELLAADEDWTWLLTPAGHPFLPVGERFVFLWEAPGGHAQRWSVGYLSTPVAKHPGTGGYLGHGLVLSEAKTLAERWASHEPGAATAAKSAQWRRGRPSPMQREIAERWGVTIPVGMTRAQLLDAIQVVQAASVIDTL